MPITALGSMRMLRAPSSPPSEEPEPEPLPEPPFDPPPLDPPPELDSAEGAVGVKTAEGEGRQELCREP